MTNLIQSLLKAYSKVNLKVDRYTKLFLNFGNFVYGFALLKKKNFLEKNLQNFAKFRQIFSESLRVQILECKILNKNQFFEKFGLKTLLELKGRHELAEFAKTLSFFKTKNKQGKNQDSPNSLVNPRRVNSPNFSKRLEIINKMRFS